MTSGKQMPSRKTNPGAKKPLAEASGGYLLVLVGGAASEFRALGGSREQIRTIQLHLRRHPPSHPVLHALDSSACFVVAKLLADGGSAAQLKNGGAVFTNRVLLVVHSLIKHHV